MPDSKFSIPIDALTSQMLADLEVVARKATYDLFARVIDRSPVGNPELWAANAEVVSKRSAYLDAATKFNAENPGKRRKATSARAVTKRFPLATGKGYVGGRFRANWNVSYGAPDESVSEATDKARAIAEAAKALSLPIGGITWMTNGLPYAYRLEYEGWSKQAPAGMVRISSTEFGDHVARAKR